VHTVDGCDASDVVVLKRELFGGCCGDGVVVGV
jgi:hypothetical protein